MKQIFSSLRLSSLTRSLTLSGVMLSLSLGLLVSQANRVRAMRDVGLPAALAIPAMEHRMSILKEQAETATVQAALGGGSSEELLHMYVLPQEHALDRVLNVLDTLTTSLAQKKQLQHLSPVQVSDTENRTMTLPSGETASVTITPLTFEADLNADGLASLSLFLKLSGLLTVGDALTSDQQSSLLQLTEEENPAAVAALEMFLGTDLLSYARAPKAVEDQLLQSFASQTAGSSVTDVLRHSLLQDVSTLLSGSFGQTLLAEKLWPLPFIMPGTIDLSEGQDGFTHVKVNVEAYGRTR